MGDANITVANTPSYVYTAVAVYMIFVTICSVVFNFLVSYVIYFKYNLSTVQSKIIFSMCLGDALASGISYPLTVYANIKHRWQLGSFLCSFYGFLTFTGGLGSILHIVLLSAERYVSIVHPFLANTLITSQNLNILLLIAWAFAVIVSSLPLMGWSRYGLEGIATSCAVDMFPETTVSKGYNVFILITGYTVPMFLITYLNLKFLKEVFSITAFWPCRKFERQSNIHDKNCLERDKAIAKSMCFLVTCIAISFNMSWLPYAIVFLMGLCGKSSTLTPLMASLPSYFAKSYTIYDPLIYFALEKKFRKLFAETFFHKMYKRKTNISISETSEAGNFYPRPEPDQKHESEMEQITSL